MEGQWLKKLIACQDFFQSCQRCSASHSARESALNMFHLTEERPMCQCCSPSGSSEVIQVRRSSYHDVVKMADISRLADITGIQAYVINSSKVVFLRRRPQPRPPKGAVGASQCIVCSRHLQDISSFCSLQCKVDSNAGIKHVSLRAASGNDSRSVTGPDTPSHLSVLKPAVMQDSGSDSDSGVESHLAKRRKGLPYRSPME